MVLAAHYVNADADQTPAHIPADNNTDPADRRPSNRNDPHTQTHTVDPTPIDPTINHNQEGSIHQVSLDLEEPNVPHKKPSTTIALEDLISSKVDTMTHGDQPFRNETHLLTHSTALQTQHGTFDSNSNVHIPDLSDTTQ